MDIIDIFSIGPLLLHASKTVKDLFTDLFKLFDSSFDEAIKEFPLFDYKYKSLLSQKNHLELRETIEDVKIHAKPEGLKKYLLDVYCKELEGEEEVTEEMIREFLDRLFDILDKKINSHSEISGKIQKERTKQIQEKIIELEEKYLESEEQENQDNIVMFLVSFLLAISILVILFIFLAKDETTTFITKIENAIFFTNIQSAHYLLSALAQSEAAVIAIVITLSLVAVQLTATSYSPRVTEIFRDFQKKSWPLAAHDFIYPYDTLYPICFEDNRSRC